MINALSTIISSGINILYLLVLLPVVVGLVLFFIKKHLALQLTIIVTSSILN
ncbi:MAG: hypothetical protein GX802_04335, partial [Clostridiales bacterium]|nr:hypothetical protein [Clostridiales bacterium]